MNVERSARLFVIGLVLGLPLAPTAALRQALPVVAFCGAVTLSMLVLLIG